jgi:hypothetical protein
MVGDSISEGPLQRLDACQVGVTGQHLGGVLRMRDELKVLRPDAPGVGAPMMGWLMRCEGTAERQRQYQSMDANVARS